jgi:hypothetical protein
MTRRYDNVIKRDVSSKGIEICQLKIMRYVNENNEICQEKNNEICQRKVVRDAIER